MSARRVVVAGGLAQRGGYGGHAWVFLQYLLGFRRLGYEVLFVDRLEEAWCADGPVEQARRLAALDTTMRATGSPIRHAVLTDGGRNVVGMTHRELAGWLRGSVMLLDVMGFLGTCEVMDAAPRRVFLDIDPGFPQMWHELGWADVLDRHDAYVTVGAGVGSPGCAVPACGLDWVTTRPPVVLEHWPMARAPARAITSVAAWRGPFAPVEFEGETYGLRAHEFRRFVSLPTCSTAHFELALDIHPADHRDRRLLVEHGWSLVPPGVVAGDVHRYRAYLQASRAELMVAKGMYVKARTGWFSDRSACYLASGRPVLAQDTGIAGHLPVGRGLLTFSTVDEARDAVERLEADYHAHAIAARRIAHEWFDSDRVLGDLLYDLGLEHPPVHTSAGTTGP